ncbi:MAG: cation:proton antiporter regulatory subunit [Anaerolineae bacterium]
MTAIKETNLPGVGVRHEFVTRSGDRLGVILHHSGRRDLLVYDRQDPDSCRSVLPLSEDDSHSLAELLGALQVTEDTRSLKQSLGGMTIDWVTVKGASIGQSLKELEVRAKTGVSVVAVMRHQTVLPAPDADFRFQEGDIAVVIGMQDGLQKAYQLLQG